MLRWRTKAFMGKHSLSVEGVTTDGKRKWEEFSMQAQHDSKDGSDFSEAKHCRMELLLQQCMNTVDSASQQWKKTHASVSEMSSKHVADMEAVIRSAIESNEQHDAEVASARTAAEEDASMNSKDILQHFESISEHERESVTGVMAVAEAHSATLRQLQKDHACLASEILPKQLHGL